MTSTTNVTYVVWRYAILYGMYSACVVCMWYVEWCYYFNYKKICMVTCKTSWCSMIQSSTRQFVIFHCSLLKPSINKDEHKQVRYNSEDGLDKNNKSDVMNDMVAEVSQISSQKRSSPSQEESPPKRPTISSQLEESLLSRSNSIEGDDSVQVIGVHGCDGSDDTQWQLCPSCSSKNILASFGWGRGGRWCWSKWPFILILVVLSNSCCMSFVLLNYLL